jgi:hypothetical protein
MTITVADLVAIDVHVHVEVDDEGHTALPQSFLDWSAKYFKSGGPRTPTIDEIAQRYRERRIAAVIFTVDCEKSLGQATDQQRARRGGRRPAQRHPHPLREHRSGPRCRWRRRVGAAHRRPWRQGCQVPPEPAELRTQ